MKKTQAFLIALIEQAGPMERGRLCRLRRTPAGGWYYNHQSWEGGRNRVRYVPASEVPAMRAALAAHARFLQAVGAFVNQAVRQTRRLMDAMRTGGSDGTRRRPPARTEPANGWSRAREARRKAAPRAGGRA